MTTSWTESGWEMKPEPWALSDIKGPSATHQLLRSLGGANSRDLGENLLAFCRVLRTVVPNISAGRVIDTCRSLSGIDLSNRADFYTALQANLISSQDDQPAFEALFRLFWNPLDTDIDSSWFPKPPRDQDALVFSRIVPCFVHEVDDLLLQ